MPENFLGYRCSHCGREYPPRRILYTCPEDGHNLDVVLDYAVIRRNASPNTFLHHTAERSIWRYAPLLPVNRPPQAQDSPLGAVGDSPMYHLRRKGEELGVNLWLKDESGNPTASFKDRASAIVVARAIDIEERVIVAASTGNAGAALAGMAAAAALKAIIFVPKSAPAAKLAQLRIFGARISFVEGPYDEAYEASLQATREFGWYNRNTGYNPFTTEGKKTAAFEIWEWALRRKLRQRLTVFVPVGDGNIISGLYKGFYDLQQLGWLDEIGGMPRLIGVQARRSAAIYQAYHTRAHTITPVHADTLADSIAVDLPRDGYRAIRAVRETGGTYVQVRDAEILQAIAALGAEGIFAEPAAAASLAGLQTALQDRTLAAELQSGSPVLLLNTGSGLKDIKTAISAAPKPKTAPLYLTG